MKSESNAGSCWDCLYRNKMVGCENEESENLPHFSWNDKRGLTRSASSSGTSLRISQQKCTVENCSIRLGIAIRRMQSREETTETGRFGCYFGNFITPIPRRFHEI